MADREGKSERETIIRFDQESDQASVYTHEKTWQQHIEKTLGTKPTNVWGPAREYEIPKKWLRLPRAPSRARQEAGRRAAQRRSGERQMVVAKGQKQ